MELAWYASYFSGTRSSSSISVPRRPTRPKNWMRDEDELVHFEPTAKSVVPSFANLS